MCIDVNLYGLLKDFLPPLITFIVGAGNSIFIYKQYILSNKIIKNNKNEKIINVCSLCINKFNDMLKILNQEDGHKPIDIQKINNIKKEILDDLSNKYFLYVNKEMTNIMYELKNMWIDTNRIDDSSDKINIFIEELKNILIKLNDK